MKRNLRVNQLIKKEISQILFREVDFPEDLLVTVTRVETSADLNRAKIYISVMPARLRVAEGKSGRPDNKSSQVLEILNRQVYFLQQKLNKRLKMRPIPKIMFREERKTAEAGRIEELLEEIHRDNSKHA